MAMLSFPIGVAFNFNDKSERGCQFRSITVDNVAFVLFATSKYQSQNGVGARVSDVIWKW